MSKDDISKIDEQLRELSGEEEKENVEETKVVKNLQELESIGEEKEEDTTLEELHEDARESVYDEESTEEIDVVEEVKDKTEEIEKVKEDKSKNHKPNRIVIISIIVGIVVILGIVLPIIFLNPKKTDTPHKELTQGQKKQIIEEYGDALEGLISVYLEKQQLLLEYDDAVQLVHYDYNVVCDEHEIYDDGQVYLNKCSIDDIGVTYSYGTKQEKPVIKEGAIKVYVSKKTKEATLKEPSDAKQYDLYSFDIEEKYSSLTLLGKNSPYICYIAENGTIQMINYITQERALNNIEYMMIQPIVFENSYDLKYVAVQLNNKKWGIYNLETDEKVVPTIYDYFPFFKSNSTTLYGIQSLTDGVIPVLSYDEETNIAKYGLINYRTNKMVISCDHTTMRPSGDYLWAVDVYGDGHLYDYNGVDQFDSSKYDNFYGVVDGKYILVRDKGDVKLVTLKEKELYNYGNINLGNSVYALSYKNGALFQFNNIDVDKEDLDHNCIEVIYDSTTKTGEVKETYCGGIAKPILYLYPERTTKVSVSFEHPEFLETTYPKYIDKWEVTAKKNGDLTDKDGKYYYGLYWDEEKIHSTDFSEGYYVTKESAINFLEKKLSYIGLNDKERNEFIMYWLPILERNEKNLVYFELTEERENYNKIFITPRPDSLLRLVIHIKKVDHEIDIPKQKLTKFQRKGFIAVEWGGTTY